MSLHELPQELVRSATGGEELFDPAAGEFVPIQDIRAQIQRLTERTPPSEAESREFLQLHQTSSQRASTTADAEAVHAQPSGSPQQGMIPAGQLEYSPASGAYLYIFSSRVFGGNTVPLLHLTSSKHASRGCEALVFDPEPGKVVFRVWDWSTPPQSPLDTHWVVGMPFSAWSDYRLTYRVHGVTLHALYVINVTRQIAADRWVNELFLHNGRSGTRDRIWQNAFTWTGEDRLDLSKMAETLPCKRSGTGLAGAAEALPTPDPERHPFRSTLSGRDLDGDDGFQIICLTSGQIPLA